VKKGYGPGSRQSTDKLEPWKKDERGEAAYLVQVGGSFTKRYARMVLFIVNAR
jgi:hypothetical protein